MLAARDMGRIQPLSPERGYLLWYSNTQKHSSNLPLAKPISATWQAHLTMCCGLWVLSDTDILESTRFICTYCVCEIARDVFAGQAGHLQRKLFRARNHKPQKGKQDDRRRNNH